MNSRQSDRLSLMEREHAPDSSEPASSGSTLKFGETSFPLCSPMDDSSAALLHNEEDHLGADDVQQARQLQMQHPQQPLKKCEFCRKPVLPQKEKQSCARSEGVVHSGCADSERRFEEKRSEAERASSLNRATEEQHECIICQSSSYKRREGAAGVVLREDTRWIKPCFCEVYAHHGCLSGVVAARQTCPQCGEKYEYRVYGSLLDFLTRYWLSYCFITMVVFFFCGIAVYSMVHVFTYPVPSWPSGRVVLLVVGLFLTAMALCCLGSCLRYTFGFRVPRFKSKYSFVRVSNYTPPRGGGGGATKRTTLLMTSVPRNDNDNDKVRGLLSFSLRSDDSVIVNSGQLPPHEFQYTSTPKIAGAPVPFDFNTPSSRAPNSSPSKHSFRRLEEHPLRLTLERVPEMPEEESVSYDDTPMA